VIVELPKDRLAAAHALLGWIAYPSSPKREKVATWLAAWPTASGRQGERIEDSLCILIGRLRERWAIGEAVTAALNRQWAEAHGVPSSLFEICRALGYTVGDGKQARTGGARVSFVVPVIPTGQRAAVRAIWQARRGKIDPADEAREWQRLWRDGRPSLHLAAATVHPVGLKMERGGLASISHRPCWVEEAVEAAARLRGEVIAAGLADEAQSADFRLPRGGFS